MLEGKYWDIGEEEILVPTKKRLGEILNALLLCQGTISSTHSLEISDFSWKYPTRSCAVVIRVHLPNGSEKHFEELTGLILTEPPTISVQSPRAGIGASQT